VMFRVASTLDRSNVDLQKRGRHNCAKQTVLTISQRATAQFTLHFF
jgi:hypothetical protein